MRLRYLPLLAVLALVGCASAPDFAQLKTSPQPELVVQNEVQVGRDKIICRIPSLGGGCKPWLAEAHKRWPDKPIVLWMCHGGDMHGEWWAFGDWPFHPEPAEPILEKLVKDNPGAVVVSLCCNVTGKKCTVPGVAYASKIVWIYPYSYYAVEKDAINDSGIGRISDFIYNKPRK